MKTPLAFSSDPLFGDLSEPLVKIEVRFNQAWQRFWCWKDQDFFWFWVEDSPDFFGLFFDGTPRGHRGRNRWFEKAARTTDLTEVRRTLRHQLYTHNWVRAVTVSDPRPGKDGTWRILWRRREFLLQNALTGRAVHFYPETNWARDSWQWHQLNPFLNDAAFFAEMFWPLFTERRGRLRTAFEFLELPVEEQDDPIRFGRGNRVEFDSVLRAALMLSYIWSEDLSRTLSVHFHHRTYAPFFGISGWRSFKPPYAHRGYTRETLVPKVERLAAAFELSLVPGFSLHNVVSCPFVLLGSSQEPAIRVEAQWPFTAHEQVEALPMVREWVARNAPELLPDWS